MDTSEILNRLDFGVVDSESEPDLDKRFVRTEDFDQFAQEKTWLVLGAKGTGKSAIFELFAKYPEVARSIAIEDLRSVIITAGSGLNDLTEIATGDIKALRDNQDRYDHEKLWTLYIAVRAAMGLSGLKRLPRGLVKGLLRAVGKERDFRILPLLKQLWEMTLGDAPSQVSITSGGATITLKNGRVPLDVAVLLEQVQSILQRNDKTLWILFDKIDEIWPGDRIERLRALESLMSVAMSIRRRFPRIQPRILLRTDIWQEMNFTNKSHLLDKKVELQWTRQQLTTLLLKRAASDQAVREMIASKLGMDMFRAEDLTEEQREIALTTIFPTSAYPGKNEARIVDWIETRVTDGRGTVLPREAIRLGNLAREAQLATGRGAAVDSLISREAIRLAFTNLSRERCDSYLAEFPELAQHFAAFRGQTTATFTRGELETMFQGLSGATADALHRLHEIGLVTPDNGDAFTAKRFEVPRLYRVGLGLVIRGRA